MSKVVSAMEVRQNFGSMLNQVSLRTKKSSLNEPVSLWRVLLA